MISVLYSMRQIMVLMFVALISGLLKEKGRLNISSLFKYSLLVRRWRWIQKLINFYSIILLDLSRQKASCTLASPVSERNM